MAPIGGVRSAIVSGRGVAIPDTVVDDFEWGGPVDDRYTAISGSISNWDITTNSPVREGDHSLKFNGGSPSQRITSDENDGLDYYPEVGDKIWTWVYLEHSDASPRIGFFVPDGGEDREGASTEINARDGSFEIGIEEQQTDSTSVSFSTDKWYLWEIDTADNDGDLEFRSTLYDGDTTDDSVLASLTYSGSFGQINERGVGITEARDRKDYSIDRIVADVGGGDPDI